MRGLCGGESAFLGVNKLHKALRELFNMLPKLWRILWLCFDLMEHVLPLPCHLRAGQVTKGSQIFHEHQAQFGGVEVLLVAYDISTQDEGFDN